MTVVLELKVTLAPQEARIFLNELYTRAYNLLDQKELDSPLSSILYRKAEAKYPNYPIEDTMELYNHLKLEQWFGSFVEFMKQTPDMQNLIVKKAEERLVSKEREVEEESNKLKGLLKEDGTG